MNLGIDIGSTKTVIFSTKDQGTLIEDEFGGREIPTVLELTKPVRSFGKSVSGDQLSNLQARRRFFFQNLEIEENQENLFMFFNYLHRTITLKDDYKNACLAIPETFNEKERQILKEIVLKSDLKVDAFLTHLTSVAACAALGNLQIDQTFMIIDCGYSKTSAGLFNFVDHKLNPLKRWAIPIGAKDFDEAIFSILIKNFNLPDSSITREKIYKEISKIKRGLNDLPAVNTKIFTESYDICNMSISRDEYLQVLAPVLSQLAEFFDLVRKESEFNGYVEVVGSNSNNAYIQQLLKDVSFNKTLSSAEAAAHGACLAHGVNSREMKFKVNEILCSEFTVKIENEDVKPVKVFSEHFYSIKEAVKIKYMKKGSFEVGVYENGEKVGLIKINKKTTESPEKIAIKVKISPFMTFEVESVEGGTEMTYVYEPLGLTQERVDQIKAIDESYRNLEVEIKLMAQKRHFLENLLDSIDSMISKVFPGLITPEDQKKIDEIRDEFFESCPVTTTAAQEDELKNKIFDSLSFILNKIAVIEKSVKEDCVKILNEFDTKISKELTFNTAALRTLNQHIYSLRGFLLSFSLNIENLTRFDPQAFDRLKNQIEKTIKIAKEEQIKEQEKVEKGESKKDSCCNNHNSCHEEECCKDSKCSSANSGCNDQCCKNEKCSSKDSCCGNQPEDKCCGDECNCPEDEIDCCNDSECCKDKDCCGSNKQDKC